MKAPKMKPKLTDRIFESVFGERIEKLADDKLKSVLESLVQETGVELERKEDAGFRSLGESRRDLSPSKQERMIVLAEELVLRNPLAERMIETFKNYVLGDGITWTAEDARVKSVLEKHWNDPINDWENKQFVRVRELSIHGELILKAFVNKENGHVRLGAIDPGSIENVIRNKENAEILESIVLKPGEGVEYSSDEERKLKIIAVNDDALDDEGGYGKLEGDVFFVTINRTTFQKRGHSDLLSVMDWLDGYDRFLFTALERAELLRAIFWHYIMEGAKSGELQKKRQEFKKGPPLAGSFLVTDEKIKINAVSPDLKSGQVAEDAKTFKAQIIAGAGLPEHFFGIGGDVNRATALEMGSPVLRMIEARQGVIRAALTLIFNFQIDQAIKAGKLPNDVDRTFTIIFPNPSPKEAKEIATMLDSVTRSLALAQESGWIATETAKKIFVSLASNLGVEITEEEVDEDEEKDETPKGADDYEKVEYPGGEKDGDVEE